MHKFDGQNKFESCVVMKHRLKPDLGEIHIRHYSFDDRRVGRGDSEFFKVTGTKDRSQRIAFIPAIAYEHNLTISPDLDRRAKSGDARAIEEVEDIKNLKEHLTVSL